MMSIDQQPRSPADPDSVSATRRTLVERAIRAWTDQLVDLSGRNGLLHYRDLPVGTLDLAKADPEATDRLLSGSKVRLSSMYPDPMALKDAARRCRKIRDKSRENLEERGVDTLYLVSDMATWNPLAGSAAVPSAPLVLRRVHLSPTGAAGEDFEVTVIGAAELNPTLFYALEAEFGVKVDLDALRASSTIEGEIDALDPMRLADAVAKVAASVQGFRIIERVVLGNFSYLKLPMVVDLETNPEALIAHDLIAAIAGDVAARRSIRERQLSVDPATLDDVVPAAEYLVLDADSSQQSAIEAVLRGSDAVIQGPPGTGKSQTIANLIASSTAKGLRVLFVAEKRAAIDAVIGRLKHVGLSDLVLDLHGGVQSRRRLAENIAAALSSAKASLPPDSEALHASLTARRALLSSHAKAMNEPREPWGVSLYQAQGRSIAAADLGIEVRLSPGTVGAIDIARLASLKEDLRAYLALGISNLTPAANPWVSARPIDDAAVESLTDATLDLARDVLPRLRGLAEGVAFTAGIAGPATAAGIGVLATTLGSRHRLAGVLRESAFDRIESLSSDLEPARRGLLHRVVASLTSSTYRSALRDARSLLLAQETSPERIAAIMADAADVQRAWATIAMGPAPMVSEAIDLEAAWRRASDLILTIAVTVDAPAPDSADLDAVASWAASLERDLSTLRKIPELRRRQALLNDAGLQEVVRIVVSRRLPIIDGLRALDGAWASAVVERVLARDPFVGSIDATRLDEETRSYVQLDRQHIGLSAARVKRAWAERAVQARDAFPDQDLLISTEAKRKMKHLPVRELFGRAPEVLTAVKPCWAMSPLLVSQILPADRPYFDLVIFDEASQILPADAIPSILRGRRVIVAGDDLQLPPTTFFASQTIPDREAEDEVLEGEGDSLATGFQSILDIADPLIGSKPLRWHYRSRDERLIAFSNLQIYRPKFRELTTFPAAADDAAIRHVRVSPRLDRTDGLSSSEEVAAVVRLVLEHAEQRPEESLGVIAMGIKHADRIGEALRLERMNRPDLDAFFAERGEEPFFVKNLERVQGDERDAIMLTIGYGRTADGRLRQNFGPINQQGGERRLNVAITRAKRRLTVVSSFGSEDVDPSRSSAEGVRLLQGYLRYAESGGSDLGDIVDPRPELNGFERDVLAALDELGINAIPQLGTSGYYLDFALQHPDKPGRYVLAVECDGATYHSAPNTRERDRLRQQQLEMIGWRFHRIWSTDWFRDRETEVRRLDDAYNQAVIGSQPDDVGEGPIAPVPESPTAETEKQVAGRGPRPTVRHYISIDFVPRTMLDAVIRWIESDGHLRTEEEIVAETIRELGFERRGRKIVAAVEGSIARVRRAGERD